MALDKTLLEEFENLKKKKVESDKGLNEEDQLRLKELELLVRKDKKQEEKNRAQFLRETPQCDCH